VIASEGIFLKWSIFGEENMDKIMVCPFLTDSVLLVFI